MTSEGFEETGLKPDLPGHEVMDGGTRRRRKLTPPDQGGRTASKRLFLAPLLPDPYMIRVREIEGYDPYDHPREALGIFFVPNN